MQCLLVKAGLPVQGNLPGKRPGLLLLLPAASCDRLTSSYRVPELGARTLCLLMVTLMGNCYCPIVVECGLFPIVLPSSYTAESVPGNKMDVA